VNFCGATGITLEMMRTHPMPEQLYEDFLVWMDDPASEIPPHTKKDAPPAVQALFDRLRRDVKLNGSSIVQTLRRNTTVSIKTAPKDYVIGPIAVFTEYARKCQEPEEQPCADLMGLSAAVFVVFLPCRPVALTRMNVGTERIRPLDGNLVVKAQEKTDFGRGKTGLVIRSAPEDRLSPRYYYDLLRARARGLGVTNSLFCSEKGQVYKRPDSIGHALVRLLCVGIKGYTGYSLRAATIQALFDAGLSEHEVNAYTGHSNRSHTAITFYYHLDRAWAGDMIRFAPTDRIPLREEARRAIHAADEQL
jgi:hypothetical protein